MALRLPDARSSVVVWSSHHISNACISERGVVTDHCSHALKRARQLYQINLIRLVSKGIIWIRILSGIIRECDLWQDAPSMNIRISSSWCLCDTSWRKMPIFDEFILGSMRNLYTVEWINYVGDPRILSLFRKCQVKFKGSCVCG